MDRVDQNRLTFELKERIPLEERSEDVSIIRNVEVNPEIEMIEEYASYRIRGFLIFTGEYESKRDEDVNQPYLLDKSAYYNKRQVKNIHYRIPVDISIPADRIDDNGLVMEITSLDYELVEPNHLLVITSVDLIGLRNEEETVEKNAHWDRVNQYDYQLKELDEEQEEDQEKEMAIDLREEEDERRTELLIEAFPISDTRENDQIPAVEENENPRDVAEELHEEKSEVVIEDKKEGDLSVERDEETELNEETEDSIEFEEETIEKQEEEIEPEVKVSISSQPSARVQARENEIKIKEDEDQIETPINSNSARYLTQFLKNREETKTQIKVCLVQPGESLEQIANRYSVSQDDILSINRLSYGSSIGGKVLKIPVRKTK